MKRRPFVLLLGLLLGLSLPACAGYAVRGGQLVDGRDRPIQLRGVNWFGAETADHLVNGLWTRNYRELIADVKAKGFNAVRLPICSDTLNGAPIVASSLNLDANPELAGLGTMAIVDRVVAELDRQGLYVLVDIHSARCGDIPPLWTTADYSEAQWIADLVLLARRYRDLPHFIGLDLRNEPHDEASWGTGNPATDWNGAAERAARAVLAEAPGVLIFVEGIQNNPVCSSAEPHLWGENLEPLACTPLDIPADRLVLSPHTYGPDVAPGLPAFAAADYPRNLPAIWERNFGRYRQQGHALVIGEFGGKYGEGDPRDRAWQDAFVAYMGEKGLRSAFYWSLNPNSRDTGGLLRENWTTWREDKLALLRRLWAGSGALPVPGPLLPLPNVAPPAAVAPPPRPVTSSSGPVEPPATSAPKQPDAATAPPAPASSSPPAAAPATMPVIAPVVVGDARFVVTAHLDSDWGQGYCQRFQVRNAGTAPGDWAIDVPLDGRVSNLWKARWTQDGAVIHARGEDYNRTLKPGEETDFGFCATRG